MVLTLPSWASSRSYGGTGPSWGQRRFIWSKVGYVPLPGGQEAFHRSEARERLVAGGEGGGKWWIGAMELVARLFWGERFWVIGPDYWHCRQELEYVHEAAKVLGAVEAVSMPVEGQCRLTLKGGVVVETMSSQDERRLTMQGVDGALMVEAAQQTLEAYYRARGGTRESLRLEARRPGGGSWGRQAGEPSPPAGRVVAEFSARQNVRDVQVVDGLPVEVKIGRAHVSTPLTS